MNPTAAPPPNPYVGPRAFETGQTLYGRDREANALRSLLLAERIVLLFSPSGAGKTSLLQAALIPKLREEAFRVLPIIRVNKEPPGGRAAEDGETGRRGDGETQTDRPLSPSSRLPVSLVASVSPSSQAVPNRYLWSTLLSLEEGSERFSPEELAQMTLDEYLWLRRESTAAESEILLFDQFEEVLTLDPTDVREKEAFFDELSAALRERQRWALFAMREDYIAALEPYGRRLPTRLGTTYRLDLLRPEAARQAIKEPARQAGVAFSDAAAAKLIDDLRRTQVQRLDGTTEERLGLFVEPVQLQVVCYRLWQELPPGLQEIGEEHLSDVGDVDRALAGYYAEQVRTVAAETGIRERAIREWVDQRLITPAGLRGQVLQEPERSQGLDNRAIERLESAHLVRGEKRRGATWFELAHDRLIQPVRENNAIWFQGNLSTLQKRAAVWDDQNRPEGLLLGGRELTEAQQWAGAHSGELLDVEGEFLGASQEQERERRNRNLRRALGVVAVPVLCGLVMAGWFYWQRSQEKQRARTIQAIATLTDDLPDALKDRPEMVAFLTHSCEQDLGLLNGMGNGSDTQRAKAVVLQHLGDVYLKQGEYRAAQRDFDEALKIGCKLWDGSSDPHDQLTLAIFYDRMGDVQRDLAQHDHRRDAILRERDLESAEEEYQQCQQHADSLLRDPKTDEAGKARLLLANDYESLLEVQMELLHWAGALRSCERRVQAGQRQEADPDAQSYLAEAYGDLIYVALLNGCLKEAKKAFDHAVELHSNDVPPKPSPMRFMIRLAHGYLFLLHDTKAAKSYYLMAVPLQDEASGPTAEQMVRADFRAFRGQGVCHPSMAEIERMLHRLTGEGSPR